MKVRWQLSPGRVIAGGFLALILLGAVLLFLPISHRDGVEVSFVDSLFTSTSAVCVTGLIAIDTADTFNVFGRTVVALLIQIGGLGVTAVGVGVMLIVGKKVGLHQRLLVKEAWNISSFGGVVRLLRAVLRMTLLFEGVGALLSFLVFVQDYPVADAIGISLFHSVAAFNNSGFDILGGLQNLIPYQDNVLLNLVTSGLIIFGGLGYLVILELVRKRSWRKFSFHAKVVLSMTLVLLVLGTLLIKATENVSWLGAFFHSVSARTAGFSTYPIGSFSKAGLLTLTVLMFIGASPGSTGGGIKTTTFFTLLIALKSAATNQRWQAFRRSFPSEVVYKAFVLTSISLGVVLTGTFLLCILEPECSFLALLFETTSAFGTVGLSAGVTPGLRDASKLLLTLIMYIGRLGPLTVATIWVCKPQSGLQYSEEAITIG